MLGLVDGNEPSFTDCDQACVPEMPSKQARLTGMKKVAVCNELG